MADAIKRRTQHRILVYAEFLCETVRSLSEVSACDQGRRSPRASSRRGISLEQRKFDIEATVHSEEGIQRFYLKPTKGTTLGELYTAVLGRLERKYTILNHKEVDNMRSNKIASSEDMAKAREVVTQMAVLREDGQYEVAGIFGALKEKLGWDTRMATSAVGNLAKGKFLDKLETVVRNHRKMTLYLVPSMKKEKPELQEPSPSAESAESELVVLLRQSPKIAEEIIDSLWAAKSQQVEALWSEILELEDQILAAQQKMEKNQSDLSILKAEVEQIEGISGRIHKNQP